MVSFDSGIDEAHEGRQTQAACGGILIVPPEEVDPQSCWSFLTGSKTRAALQWLNWKEGCFSSRWLSGGKNRWMNIRPLPVARAVGCWRQKKTLSFLYSVRTVHVWTFNMHVWSSWCHNYRNIYINIFKSHLLIMAFVRTVLSQWIFYVFFFFKSADVEWLRGHGSVSRVPRRSGFSPKPLSVSLGLPSCPAHVHTNLLRVCWSACAGTQPLCGFPWISPIRSTEYMLIVKEARHRSVSLLLLCQPVTRCGNTTSLLDEI